MNKWLPMIMGCHCNPKRSFFYHGKQFPVCARCTGELIGFALAVVTAPFFRLGIIWLLLLLVPALTDGLIQRFTSYESNNALRFITGIALGYSIMSLLIISLVATVKLGFSCGLKWFADSGTFAG